MEFKDPWGNLLKSNLFEAMVFGAVAADVAETERAEQNFSKFKKLMEAVTKQERPVETMTLTGQAYIENVSMSRAKGVPTGRLA